MPSDDDLFTRRVLVVEDEPRLRQMLLRAIRDMEFEVRGAATAGEALAALRKVDHDIVLTDLNLPGEDGLELCEAVRRMWPRTQLVILTGYGDLEAAQRAIRLDVVDFLTKPCALGDLEAALDRALRRRRHGILPSGAARADAEVGAAEGESETDGDEEAAPRSRTLQDLEREQILEALARHDGNRAATAEALGISVRTLYYRLAEYERQGFIDR